MTIKNNGKKIVHVGSKALMPGAEITVADKVAQTPAIQILAKHGILVLTADDKAENVVSAEEAKPETPEATAADGAETGTDAAVATKKTSARKTSAKTAAAAE